MMPWKGRGSRLRWIGRRKMRLIVWLLARLMLIPVVFVGVATYASPQPAGVEWWDAHARLSASVSTVAAAYERLGVRPPDGTAPDFLRWVREVTSQQQGAFAEIREKLGAAGGGVSPQGGPAIRVIKIDQSGSEPDLE